MASNAALHREQLTHAGDRQIWAGQHPACISQLEYFGVVGNATGTMG